MTAEERVALILLGREGIQKAIEELVNQMNQMVGQLWPSVLFEQIGELRRLERSLPREVR